MGGAQSFLYTIRHRKNAWYVSPVDLPGCMHDNKYCGENVLCGHLFDAAAEGSCRRPSVSIEECCIAMESIADARLSFSDCIHVRKSQENLTGVQLLCGHRFSAVNLLWYWCMSPMICPVCRAKYVGVTCSTSRSREKPRPCKLENFPTSFWTILCAQMPPKDDTYESDSEVAYETDEEETQQVQAALLDDVTVHTYDINDTSPRTVRILQVRHRVWVQ